jgi:nucleoside-diphosphate-sugar epimerase
MRVVVVGATGNVGSSLTRLLAADPAIESVVGIARRRPELTLSKTTWVEADIVTTGLEQYFRDADAVVHLAWLIQPSHDLDTLRNANVVGSGRVFEAAAEVGVGTLVYASSVGTYSPGPKDRLVDESWPVAGVPESFYSRHKAEVERRLDAFEREHPQIRVVRLRPGLIFKRDAATGIRRLFAGPLAPTSLLQSRFVPFLPLPRGLRFQTVHTDDVAEAYRLALLRDVRGAFNVAADPILDAETLASVFDARAVEVPPPIVHAVVSLAWRLHLQPTPPGWVDLALAVPLLDCSRARDELGWKPAKTATETLRELLRGLREGAGDTTPPLDADGDPARLQELKTGVGERAT